ncbi:UDP-N-acetylmuramoyl-L-alanyl-D-glutamate--2,6-diaminopimelate ligase [Virgibacillus phasianinus]|uniref:UDP-N-acetylmuramoyl-L-alanyl-D-glutamate--2, 6-diaminopimelate ligase n=1 Tax=Virgibacillus phasianinus TaxID=2017483 RepID=A0A220TZX3_9BACI|nr:UDP-N-acetylmuramoyl-L-alanyl-D-glutamate--2,6-diaminopimelate ligase [Virgibacillus phasianinus]ASK61305.1 UDP-N-acetylmuramoyl-L-alanyl-D-glutamate--2,6-diaminopimelate ligase [Virgibacillus phasianinus]
MELQYLLNGLTIENKLKNQIATTPVEGIADSSLEVKRNHVFIAIEGFQIDGHSYINDAIKKGACIIIGERNLTDLAVPYIKVSNSRKALGIIANNFYGNPSKQKLTIGITGTNGKTTTSYLLKHILEKNGQSCSLFGSIHNIINGEVSECVNTTPSSLVLQKLLSTSNDDIVIMEVSSHGLKQFRLEGIEFDYCLFTNLDQDHLDYHTSMEKYFQAKLLLFDKLKENGKAIVNVDDLWGRKLNSTLQNRGIKPFTMGQFKDCNLEIIDFNYKNSTIKFEKNNQSCYLYSPMFGIHNMYNTLMAYSVASLLNLKKDLICSSTYDFSGVEGRFEILKLDNGATIVIDYAHTADAYSQCLSTAKYCGAKRLIHVFGFRGNRDSGKRQAMLSVTAEMSDQYILTLDNLNTVPKNEMLRTMENINNTFGNKKGTIIGDRTIAIKRAMEQSVQGDWIIITGKGHEEYQQNYCYPTKTDKETVIFLNNQQKYNQTSSQCLT